MYIIGAIHIPYKHIVMNKNDGTDTDSDSTSQRNLSTKDYCYNYIWTRPKPAGTTEKTDCRANLFQQSKLGAICL